jgi:hypothetical protein
MPATISEMKKFASGFASLSFGGRLNGFDGAGLAVPNLSTI